MRIQGDDADWLDEVVVWWMNELGPQSPLMLPDPELFELTSAELLAVVTYQAGMEEWDFELVEDQTAVDDPAVPHAALGADDPDDDLPEGGPFPITIPREKEAHVQIADFARAVSHYLLYTAREPPPCDDVERPAVADVGAMMLGFGLFLANTAAQRARLRSRSDASRTESALAYLLAIFVELHDGNGTEELALEHLAPDPRAAFLWARAELRGPRRAVLDRLRVEDPPLARRDGPYR